MPGISSNVRCYIRVCHKALFLLFVLERFAISALSLMNLFFFFLMIIKQIWWLRVHRLSLASESVSSHLLLIKNIITFAARKINHLSWQAR